jgi:hypothetical protein
MRTQHFLKNTAGHHEWRTSVFACKNARRVRRNFSEYILNFIICQAIIFCGLSEQILETLYHKKQSYLPSTNFLQVIPKNPA